MPELAIEQSVESGNTAAVAVERDTGAANRTQSDEELIGLEPEPYRAEYQAPVEQQEQEKASRAADSEENEARADEEAVIGQPMPESLKKAMEAAPEIKTELQRLWDEHQAFREVFPTVGEARAVKELFPEGAEQAKLALSKAMELEQSDALFASRDPQSQRELASKMLEFDPQAFGAMLLVSAELVRERNPELYRGIVGSLNGHGTTTTAKGRPTATNAREEQLENEFNSITEQQGAAFAVSVNQSAMPQIDAEIRKLIEPAAKGLNANAREGALESLARQIHDGIEQRLRSDLHYHGQLAAIQAGLRFGVKNHNAVSKAIVSRALYHLKPVAKQVLQSWAPRHIEQGKQTAEKAEKAARRTDIGGGGLTHGRPSARLTRDEAREMTDSQLMDWAFRR
jgi:hypothetical protein